MGKMAGGGRDTDFSQYRAIKIGYFHAKHRPIYRHANLYKVCMSVKRGMHYHHSNVFLTLL